MNLIHGFHLKNLRGDVYGGVTAAVVALPLALAFGVASGIGPIAGLYGAIFVGFFAALLGGTPSQISGPTGPMTVVMAAVFLSFSDHPEYAVTVVVLGGLFQILFGAVRIGSLINLVPVTVVSGFMSGIGVIIIILQIPALLGHPPPGGGVLHTALALPALFKEIHWDTTITGLAVLAFVWFLPARINRILPGTLIALVVASLIVWRYLPDVPVLGDIPTGFPDFKLPGITVGLLPNIVGWALVLAFLGAIDSLLTSVVADNVTRNYHRPNRELIGQGIGNVVAGFFGAIPGAGATMRTLVNIRAGGSTPLSGMIHALGLLAIVLGVGPLASHIPHTVLAGILFKVGIDIIDWPYLRRIARAPRAGVTIMLMVLVLTVFVDLIIAFAAGMIAASLLFVKRMADLQIKSARAGSGSDDELILDPQERSVLANAGDRILLYRFSGPISFGAAKGISRQLTINDHHKVLLLDFVDVPMIDTSGAFGIEEIVSDAIEQGVAVVVVGMRSNVYDVLDRLGSLAGVGADHRFDVRLPAFERAAELAGT